MSACPLTAPPPPGSRSLPKVTPAEFQRVCAFVYRISGIALQQDKAYLVQTRIGPLLSAYHCGSYAALMDRAEADPSGAITRHVLDVITTQETLFFRDKNPYALLRHKIIPDLIDRRSTNAGPRRIRIWSAASSTGQEIYSVAMTLKELLVDLSRYHVHLLGTDISSAAIARASAGRYSDYEVQRGLSEDRLSQHFSRIEGGWQVRDELRALCSFRKLNLMESFTSLGPFDLVLCRNVAIYFKPEDRSRLFDRIAEVLTPGGILLIGSSEFLTGVSRRFVSQRHLQAVYYQLATGG